MVSHVTHNTNLISTDGASRTLDIRGKWINWLDGKNWKLISSAFFDWDE